MNNFVFGKTMENVRKHIKPVRSDKQRNCLVSEPNYHTAKGFSENPLTVEMNKTCQNEQVFVWRYINSRHQQNSYI